MSARRTPEQDEQRRVNRRRWSREHAARKRAADPRASNAKQRALYAADPEKFKKRASDAYWADPEKGRNTALKYQATRRVTGWHLVLANGFRHPSKVDKYGPPDIDGAYILELFEKQNGLCHWLGIPMVPSATKRDPRRPSVDRLDNFKGYVRDNVVLTTMFANMGRSGFGEEDFRVFLDELKVQIRK